VDSRGRDGTGRVRDAESGEPLEGVLVLEWQSGGTEEGGKPVPLSETRTDATGRYEWDRTDRTSLLFWKEGFHFRIVAPGDLDTGECGWCLEDVLLEQRRVRKR